MFSRGVDRFIFGSLTFAGVASLSVATSLIPGEAGVGIVAEAIRMLNTEAWVMGGSGNPLAPQGYIDALMANFVNPALPFFEGQPVFPVDSANGLFTGSS